jgi:hypothetical protein
VSEGLDRGIDGDRIPAVCRPEGESVAADFASASVPMVAPNGAAPPVVAFATRAMSSASGMVTPRLRRMAP